MSTKLDMFLIGEPEMFESPTIKGRRLMIYNPRYEGRVTAQDLIDFLREKGIDPSKVPLYSFATYISEGDVEGEKDGE